MTHTIDPKRLQKLKWEAQKYTYKRCGEIKSMDRDVCTIDLADAYLAGREAAEAEINSVKEAYLLKMLKDAFPDEVALARKLGWLPGEEGDK